MESVSCPAPSSPLPPTCRAYRACVLFCAYWNASVVPLGFGHRHRGDRKVSANSLGNSFRNTYADYGVVRKRMSFGYPLDEDGNYPEGWY